MFRSIDLPSVVSPATARACQNCSRAKAKCEPHFGEPTSICARCFRLKKECIVLPRRVRKKRSPNAHTNITQLEQKIEGLVTLITSKQGSSIPTPTSAQSQIQNEEPAKTQATADPSRFPSPSADWAVGTSDQNSGSTWDAHIAVDLMPNAALPTPPFLGERLQDGFSEDANSNSRYLSREYDNEYLVKVFKQQFSPHFPFVIIPPLITSDELQFTRPWIHRVIVMIASQYQRANQIEKAKQILLDISAAMLLRGERSLDMVQSLILYNAWSVLVSKLYNTSYVYSQLPPSAQSTGIFHLMLAMLFDLGLTKPSHEYDNPSDVCAEDHTRRDLSEARREVKRTLEERRTFLSCFLIGSTIAQCAKKVEGIQETPYLENCCQVLEEAHENENDILLVYLVRLHCIIESTKHFVPSKTNAVHMTAPISVLVKQTQINLQAFWDSLPPSIQQHTLMKISYHDAELCLYEHCLTKTAWPPSFSGSIESQRLDMLYSCVLSCKAVLDIYANAPLTTYYALSTIGLAHMGHGFSIILKISVMDEPGWDMVQIRQMLNFTYYSDQISAKFEEVGDGIDANQPIPFGNSFSKGCALAMRKVKTWYDRRFVIPVEQGTLHKPKGTMGMVESLTGDEFRYLDDAYWLELVGDCDFMP